MRKIFFILFLLFSYKPAYAGEVLASKRGRILVNTFGEKYKLNQKLYVYNPNTQRKMGVIKVTQRRRDQEAVVAKLIGGRAPRGALVESAERSIANEADSETDIRHFRTRAREIARRGRRDIASTIKVKHGIGFTMLNSQLSVKSYGVTSNLSGTGLGFDYNLQVPVQNQMAFLGCFGYHPVSLTSSSSSGNSNNFEVTYLSAVGLLKYIFNHSLSGPWLGAGGGIIYPSSKSSNVLSSDTISTNSSFNLAAGTDLDSRKQMISFKLEYAYFPSSNSEKTSANFSQINLGVSFFF